MRRLVLFGPPGSGKGTLGIGLSQLWGVPHIASGDLLRRILAEDDDSELGRAARVINEGGMVTDDVASAIVFRTLMRPEASSGFVLDGFPRNVAQAERLDSFLSARGERLDAAMALEIDDVTLVERLMGRLTCPVCGETYHVRNAPPRVPGICDRCGATLTVREDDRPDAIRTRVRLYLERTEPLYGYYALSGRLRTVSATGTPDEVLARCLQIAGAEAGMSQESLV